MKETTICNQLRKGGPWEGRLGECPKGRDSGEAQRCEAIPHRQSAAESNLRADEQEPHRRSIRHDELAQHSEVVWFTRGGKCGGCAGKHHALTWGMVAKRTWRA